MKIKAISPIILLLVAICVGQCGVAYAFSQDTLKTSCHLDSSDQSESAQSEQSKSQPYDCCGEYVVNKSYDDQIKFEPTLNSSVWLSALEVVSGTDDSLRLSNRNLDHPEVTKPVNYISVTTPIHAPPVSL